MYRDVYGYWDGVIDEVNLVVYCEASKSVTCDSFSLAGRSIARAFGRDSGAKTADGVIVLEGSFGSGGSVKNWTTRVSEGTVFRVLHVPRKKALELVANPEWWTTKIEIESEKDKNDKSALLAERERLVARIAEIDRIIGGGRMAA
jgi:hypothetical protein